MLPTTLGRDLSGTVESSGPDVGALREGDAVYALLSGIDRGSYAEYAIVKPNEAAAKPSSLSHVEAAAAPLAALTAWQGLSAAGRPNRADPRRFRRRRPFRDPVRQSKGRYGIHHRLAPEYRLCQRARRRPGD
jgi:NADPH:quinone reductase-like Zn-dependent oxidoreductase